MALQERQTMPPLLRGYVIVINRSGPVPLRHIVDWYVPYDEESFKEWYYENYHKLDGDEFTYCKGRTEMLNYVEEIRNADY